MTTTDIPRPADVDSGRRVSKKRSRKTATGGLRQAVSATTLLWLMACLYGFPVLWFVLSSPLLPATCSPIL